MGALKYSQVHRYFESNVYFLKNLPGTSLVVQWLGLCASSVGGLGLIPGQGTRSHMPQLRLSIAKQISIFKKIMLLEKWC